MTAAVSLPIRTRPMQPGDLPFIVSTWMHSLPCPKWFDADAWKSNARRSINAIIKSSSTVVLCSDSLDSSIHAYVCGLPATDKQESVVHHAYVRPSYVRCDERLAAQLIDDMRKELT